MTSFPRIGGPILTMVIGAILYFALNLSTSYANMKMVGLIILIAGAAWLVLELVAKGRKTVATNERITAQDSAGRQTVTDHEVQSGVQ